MWIQWQKAACIEGIFKKALELLSKENAIVPAPGQSLEARMVLSFTRFSQKLPGNHLEVHRSNYQAVPQSHVRH